MMDSGKKKMAAEIVGKLGGKKPAGPSPDSDAEEYEGDAETAAQEFIDAVKGGDAAAVVESFKALKAAC